VTANALLKEMAALEEPMPATDGENALFLLAGGGSG